MEMLRQVEGVPPDSILPSAALKRVTMPITTSDWWSFIPALWLFSRLKGVKHFESENAELKWWAERIQPLADGFALRAFDQGEKLDLELEDAAVQVCQQLAERTPDELLAFIDDRK